MLHEQAIQRTTREYFCLYYKIHIVRKRSVKNVI